MKGNAVNLILMLMITILCIQSAFPMSQAEKNAKFFDAVHRKSLQAIKNAIKEGADPFALNAQGDTALFESVFWRYKNPEITEYLLELGIDVNHKRSTGLGGTALLIACGTHNLTILKMLLDHGANPNIVNNVGITPLIFACSKINIDMVKLFLEYGAQVNYVAKKTSFEPGYNYEETSLFQILQTATESSSQKITEIMKLLLDHGANVNYQESKTGQTALMKAININHTQILKLILTANPDRTIKDFSGNDSDDYIMESSPAMRKIYFDFFATRSDMVRAIKEDNIRAMRYIATKKSWILAMGIDEAGNTPLHLAIEEHGKEEVKGKKKNMIPMIQEMLKIEPELLMKIYKIKNKTGFTPLMLAPNKPNVLKVLMGSEKGWNKIIERSTPQPMDISD